MTCVFRGRGARATRMPDPSLRSEPALSESSESTGFRLRAPAALVFSLA